MGSRRRLLRWLLLLAVIATVAVVAVSTAVLWRGRAFITTPERAPRAQAVIVLGALVFPDGGVSDMLADRLETAYDLYKAGRADKILVTGDHGQTSYDEVNTMRRYLERKGVRTTDIFMDHAGFDTYDSMYRARDVFAVQSALVVTQRFHLPRALYIARALGLEAHGVIADRHVYPGERYYDLREAAARVKAFGSVLLRRRPVFLGPAIPISGDGRATQDL